MSGTVRIGNGPRRERGAALVISLILLLVMTLLGVVSLRTTALEEKMAANARDRQIAFGAAEAALLDAEQYLEDNVITLGGFDADGSDGLYDEGVDLDGDGDVDGVDEYIWRHVDWSASDDNNDNEVIVNDTYQGSADTAPRFVIRHYGSVQSGANALNPGNYGSNTGSGEVDLFRITVRATGGSDTGVVLLQSTYGKRL